MVLEIKYNNFEVSLVSGFCQVYKVTRAKSEFSSKSRRMDCSLN